MSFKTENRKIKDLFEKSCQYIVPRYQRDYVWNKTNWSELISDIKFTMNTTGNIQWSHFLGTIVLNNMTEQFENNEDTNKGLTLYEIVDGQQRLTTIYILFASITYRFKQITHEESEFRVKYIHDTFLTSLDANSSRELMIVNDKLNSDLRHLITDVMNNENIQNNFFYNLFNYFYDEIKEYSFIELDRFLNKLLSINIVEIISDQEEEIYNIFEVLNARGRPLKQMELLKNHIMKYIQPHNTEYIDQAKEKWEKIENNYSHLTDIDSLLIHFIKCYIKKDAEGSDKVYKLIKEEIPISELSIFLDSFYEYSEAYKIVTNPAIHNEYIEYFDIKRNKQIRSLLGAIEVLHKKSIINDDLKKITFKHLRNYFFIFNICSHTSNKTDKIVSKMAYDVYHCNESIHYRMLFTRFFCDLYQMIKDEDIKTMFINNQTLRYSNQNASFKRNGRLVKYILYILFKTLQNDTVLVQDQLTIEHLTSDDGSIENSSLYNLTLTSANINSERLKNKTIQEKVKILSEESSIVYNKNLSNYINGDSFDFERRKNDLISEIIEAFQFDRLCFGINEDEYNKYFFTLNKVSKNEALSKLLMQTGKNFELVLNKNPKYHNFKLEYENIKKS